MIGQVGVDLDPWLGIVLGVHLAGAAAHPPGPEELTVGRRGGSVAPVLREALAVMGVDDPGQCSTVVLVGEVPVVRPGQLRVADTLAGVRHPLETEVGGICKTRGEHGVGVVVLLSSEGRRVGKECVSTGAY